MAVKIRLRKQGKKNRQTFRLVVTDVRTPRDGKYLENVGWYQPSEKSNNIHVNEERVSFWLGQGAQLSEKAEKLIGMGAPTLMKKLQDQRQARLVIERAKRRASKKEKATAAKS